MERKLADRIVINPAVMVGKPVIKGTRIPVALIIKLLAQGLTPKEILEDYPQLTKSDIQAALQYVSSIISDEEVILKK